MAEALRSDPAGRARALLFQLDKRCWAVDARFVARVLPDQPVRPAGFLPSQFRGVVAYAGEVLPLLDLRKRLGLPADHGDAGELLVLTFAGQNYALRVDRVIQIIAHDDGEELLWRGQAVSFVDLAAMFAEALEETALAPLQAPPRKAIESAPAAATAELPGLDEIRAATAASLVVETATGRERLPRYCVIELCETLARVAVPDPRPLFAGAAFYRDRLLPIVSLDHLLGRTEHEPSADKVFVIVDLGGRLCALSVKTIIGMSNDPAPILDLRALLQDYLPEEANEPTTLHRRSAEVSETEPGTRFLVTEAAGRPCGFNLDSVVHIHAASAVIRAPSPHGAAPIGVAAIAGRVMPVLDLPDSLGLGPGAARQQFIEFSSPEDGNFAVAVDRVIGISAIAPSALLPAPRGSNISAVVAQGEASLLWIVDALSLAQSLQGDAHAG